MYTESTTDHKKNRPVGFSFSNPKPTGRFFVRLSWGVVKTRDLALEQQRKQHIILTARRLLAEGSHAGVSLSSIAKEAGVSKGMLTYYFASKDELITATIADHLARQEELLIAVAADRTTSVRDRLERMLELALPSGERATDELRFIVEVWSYAKTRPSVMELVQIAYKRFRKHGQRLLAMGAREGYVTAKDHAWVNIAINALLDGLSFQLAVDRELDAADLRRRVLRIVDMLVTSD